MSASIAAHDLGRTYDCAWPSCPREARREGGYCDQGHVGTPPAGARGRVEPGSLAHLTDDEPEPVKEPAMPVCKVPGCGEPDSGLRGPLQRLCAAHVEEKRAELAAAAKAKWAERHAKINSTRTPHDPTRVEVEAKPPVAVPEPAPEPAPSDGTLAELGRRVDERIARIHALTQEITAERDLLADDVTTFQARVRQAQPPEKAVTTTPEAVS